MRLPHGILQKIGKETGIDPRHLAGYAGTCRRPCRERALVLEQATTKLGFPVDKVKWLYGSQNEIKSALMGLEEVNDDAVGKTTKAGMTALI